VKGKRLTAAGLLSLFPFLISREGKRGEVEKEKEKKRESSETRSVYRAKKGKKGKEGKRREARTFEVPPRMKGEEEERVKEE